MESRTKWPKVEAQLYGDFLQKRTDSKIICQGWFQIMIKEQFMALYPDWNVLGFMFSVDWLTNFLPHHCIAVWFTTNLAQRTQNYLSLILESFNLFSATLSL